MRLAAIVAVVFLAGCTHYADTAEVVGGHAVVQTHGDVATAASRARLACGDPKRVPVLMTVTGTGEDQVATFGCM
jgi:hypothetical protein